MRYIVGEKKSAVGKFIKRLSSHKKKRAACARLHKYGADRNVAVYRISSGDIQAHRVVCSRPAKRR